MDRKSIALLALSFGLLLLWKPLIINRFYPNTDSPPVVAGTNTAATAGTNSVTPTSTPVVPGAAIPTVPPAQPGLVMRSEVPEQMLVVTNENARYIFTSRGGGLKEVQLLRYEEEVSTRRRLKHATNDFATLNSPILAPVFAITGDASLQDDGAFHLSLVNGAVRAEKNLASGLTMVKEFKPGTNYLMSVSVRLENHSPKPLALPVQEWAIGAATPMNAEDNGLLTETVLWYNGSGTEATTVPYFDTNTTTMIFFARTPKSVYVAGSNNVVWASAQNQFFVLAAMPEKPAAALVVRRVTLPPPTEMEMLANPAVKPNPQALQAALVYTARTLAAGEAVETKFELFAGPKEYQTLAVLGARFKNDIDLVMNFGWVSPISKVLLVIMNWMHYAIRLPYGWVIILITIIIKTAFWPLTRSSTRSMKRMQELQPQIKAINDKYKDDPQKKTQKTMEFYKKNKVNPLGGCLPMLLQIPVFFGFYGMLRTAIELRAAPFLWIGDLSKPDTIFFIPGVNFPVNPMPIIMGATLLWQASVTPPSPGMDPAQQKIMKFMPLVMMLLFMYDLSSGLALYWTVNNLLTILQTRLTRTDTPAVAAPAAVVAPQKKK